MLAAENEVNTVPVQWLAPKRCWGSSSQAQGSSGHREMSQDPGLSVHAVAACVLHCRAKHTG